MKNSELFNNNNTYLCVLARCAHFIRGNIKKYIRYRTSLNQPTYCSKETLDERNANKYGCPNPIPEDYICPTFEFLMNKYKSDSSPCKKIFNSSKMTHDGYTCMSKLSYIVNPAPRNNTSRKLAVAIPTNKVTGLLHRRVNKTKRQSRTKKPAIKYDKNKWIDTNKELV